MMSYAISFNGEHYSENYSSIDVAIGAAAGKHNFELGDGSVWVGEIRQPRQPEEWFDADMWLEQVACQDEYTIDAASDWYPDAIRSNEALKELETFVRAVMAAWLDKHNLRPTHFMVDNEVRYGFRRDDKGLIEYWEHKQCLQCSAYAERDETLCKKCLGDAIGSKEDNVPEGLK